MKKNTLFAFILFNLVSFSSLSAMPADMYGTPPYMIPAYPNEISMEFSAEQWVSTQTARVILALDAIVDANGVGLLHQQMLKELHTIADSEDWHITQFDRSQNQSGLEQIHAQAEARLKFSDLTKIRERAKSITKPGKTYTINSIDFSPSLAEREQAKANLRQHIYQAIQEELMRINKNIGNQSPFVVHLINFNPMRAPTPPVYKAMMAERTGMAENKVADDTALPPMSENVRIEAHVSFSAVNDPRIKMPSAKEGAGDNTLKPTSSNVLPLQQPAKSAAAEISDYSRTTTPAVSSTHKTPLVPNNSSSEHKKTSKLHVSSERTEKERHDHKNQSTLSKLFNKSHRYRLEEERL